MKLVKVSVGEMTAVKRVELEFNLTYFKLSLCQRHFQLLFESC